MKTPHVIPYQGSKRKLAEAILSNIDFKIDGRFFEPFAGSAAVTLTAANSKIADHYIIGDKYEPLIELWRRIIETPNEVSQEYEVLWNSQLEDPKEFFSITREQFNSDYDPVKFLYLVTRCVKNAIRFNSSGHFNQSPDNRRLGTRPDKVQKEILKAFQLLSTKTELRTGDFMDILEDVNSEDVVYMDPPWQGTSLKKNPRYAHLLELESLIEGLEILNIRNVPYLLSFDGTCGDKSYGSALPDYLNLTKIGINTGRSSQATLLGRNDVTIESLYLSPAFTSRSKSKTWKDLIL